MLNELNGVDLTPDFHDLVSCPVHKSEPCTCCSPAFSMMADLADWDAMINPQAWNASGKNREIYAPTCTVVFINANRGDPIARQTGGAVLLSSINVKLITIKSV